ncbi:glycoside hydrolase family protein [Erwinia psidii]|uniref:Lysozyme n=1 Tax=Erwinia psidii TaxID=69224 RepID=A0A3N6SFY7_9GAMM|nr:glycoside hydrolase family protein [Erwinia psidii]MCX8955759.1 lysozyme [Erwinia psidii]MCX8961683.1 lysozyme [Erwinia psidii]MCX8965785.1 lysozyme [Erwinia psidii]RQM37601.1 lysozyme [Erwinia psidii]
MASVNDSLSFSTAGYGQLRIREGLVYRYYNDLGPHSGNCSWGVGSLAHFGVCTDEELNRPVTASDINTALAKHVHKVERYIRRKISHHPLTQAQFDGLVSFIYNVSDPSAVMETTDRGDMKAVHDKMLQYIYVFKHDAKAAKSATRKF